MLLGTQGKKPSVWTAYLAMMVCYLGNMAIPRLGEVARCTIMKREENIPLPFSLGTVITDRLLDLFMLIICTLLLLSLQFNLLKKYFLDFANSKLPGLVNIFPYLVIGGIIMLTAVIIIVRKQERQETQKPFYSKIKTSFLGLIEGIKSVKNVANPLGFWLSTIGIWLLYFTMLYVISFGYGPTDELSLVAGLAVLVMGSLGMAAPVNNGIGAYQALVASILVIYGISYNDGFVFAIISHGSQVVSVIFLGFICLLILNFRNKKKRLDTNAQ